MRHILLEECAEPSEPFDHRIGLFFKVPVPLFDSPEFVLRLGIGRPGLAHRQLLARGRIPQRREFCGEQVGLRLVEHALALAQFALPMHALLILQPVPDAPHFIAHFVQAVGNGAPFRVRPEEVRASIDVVERCYQMAEAS